MATQQDLENGRVIVKDGVLGFKCIGCGHSHWINVDGSAPEGKNWQWNGDLIAPTITPSVLGRSIDAGKMTDEEFDNYQADMKAKGTDWALQNSPFRTCCHLFIRDGRVQYLADCTHALAGQTIELPVFFQPPRVCA